jgi:hypothetical protein
MGNRVNHRYLMTRLSLQVVYLWRHVSSTAPPFILWWSNLEILFGPLHRRSPFIGELRCQAIQMEHGPYIAERTQKAVYIVRCLWPPGNGIMTIPIFKLSSWYCYKLTCERGYSPAYIQLTVSQRSKKSINGLKRALQTCWDNKFGPTGKIKNTARKNVNKKN